MDTIHTNEIEVRTLNTKDFWTVLNIVKKGGKEAISRLDSLPEGNDMARGMFIIDIGLEYAEKELSTFLASLAGLTIDEYLEGPFDLTLAIAEKMAEQEDLENFFKRIAALAKKFSKKSEANLMATAPAN